MGPKVIELNPKVDIHLLYLVGVFLCVLVTTHRTIRDTSFIRW
jgi:hypothetical protein